MPELPETETIARDLDSIVRGAVIRSVQVPRADVLREVTAIAIAHTLKRATISRVWRRAKLIVLDVQVGTELMHLVVQPRFTGGLFISGTKPVGADAKYACVSIAFTDARFLTYRDVRRLGTVALMTHSRFTSYADALGIEPLDQLFTPEVLSVLLRATGRPVKVLLMDQRRLAGIGNIYANEALWLAKIDPSREARGIDDAEATALHLALQQVLTASIAARGTSFRDYRDAHGERGSFVTQLAAYGRQGQTCPRCGDTLVGTHAIDGRSTVYCPTCQQ